MSVTAKEDRNHPYMDSHKREPQLPYANRSHELTVGRTAWSRMGPLPPLPLTTVVLMPYSFDLSGVRVLEPCYYSSRVDYGLYLKIDVTRNPGNSVDATNLVNFSFEGVRSASKCSYHIFKWTVGRKLYVEIKNWASFK